MRTVQTLSSLLWIFAIACSSAQASKELSTAERPVTTILVRNQKPVDFNFYVADGTRRIRLGTVTGMSERTFVIPPHMVIDQGSLHFQADPIGSDQVLATDEALNAREGDGLTLTIR
jgi:hypothetical protein